MPTRSRRASSARVRRLLTGLRPDVLARLVIGDTVRAMSRRRLWLLTSIVAGAGAIMIVRGAASRFGTVVQAEDGTSIAVYDFATVTVAYHLSALSLMAFVLPLALGDTLAQDLRSRYVVLLMSRGVSRASIYLSRIISGVVAAAFSLSIVTAMWLGVACVVTPHFRGPVGAVVAHGSALLTAQPLVYFVAAVGLSSVACGTVLAMCYGISLVVASGPIAALVPPLSLLMGIWLPELFSSGGTSSVLTTLNPAVRITFLGSAGAWAAFGSTAWYWMFVLSGVAFFGVIVCTRTERW